MIICKRQAVARGQSRALSVVSLGADSAHQCHRLSGAVKHAAAMSKWCALLVTVGVHRQAVIGVQPVYWDFRAELLALGRQSLVVTVRRQQ
jgi:hypothetical protein